MEKGTVRHPGKPGEAVREGPANRTVQVRKPGRGPDL